MILLEGNKAQAFFPGKYKGPASRLFRPVFPKRAVITAGMPYGNKNLHFGHVGGMFVHADVFARFLRDRIGEDNVLFVSGTDCYGSPIMESFRKLQESGISAAQNLQDYVANHHQMQKQVLQQYGISLDYFGASALGRGGDIHRELSAKIFLALYRKGWLRLLETPQFFDPKYKVLLNGRQVVGKCPIAGCPSDKAYADECALGHQYMPSELLEPKSVLSGEKPQVISVQNWYFDLERFANPMKRYVEFLRTETTTRPYVCSAIEEFLKPPALYVQKKHLSALSEWEDQLPPHTVVQEDGKPSVTFVFENLQSRDTARAILDEKGIRYRTGKTLVPFRLSGNVEWGVPVPVVEGVEHLTFWVWPESLWAPISFTMACLEQRGCAPEEWRRWWGNSDCTVYQFIGEDNIYFYGIAEMGMFAALLSEDPEDMHALALPRIVANRHALFLDKKASSSSDVKPPMADELLDFYTPEQLRMHFLSLGLSTKSGSFRPQAWLPKEQQQGGDPVLKEGNLLTNVMNRVLRSFLYTLQNEFGAFLPTAAAGEQIKCEAQQALLDYERFMYCQEFHRVSEVLDVYIRGLNRQWVGRMRRAEEQNSPAEKQSLLVDTFYGIKAALLMLHPVAPDGCEKAREYLRLPKEIWSWEYAFTGPEAFVRQGEQAMYLPPKTDFFAKHPSQLR